MTKNHQGHLDNITVKDHPSMSKTPPKSTLPYLLLEALENGSWGLVATDGNNEEWQRGTETIKIGKKLLKGTTPPSVVYEVSDPEINFRRTDSIVINLLCTRLAKARKLSEWFDNVNTTE